MQNYEDVCEYSVEHFQSQTCIDKYQNDQSENLSSEIKIQACDWGEQNGNEKCYFCSDDRTCPEFIQEFIDIKKSGQFPKEEEKFIKDVIKEWKEACSYVGDRKSQISMTNTIDALH